MFRISVALAVAALSAASAQTLTTLANFNGANGNAPTSPPVEGPDGNFYGTTNSGGANNSCNIGCGTVYRISASGTLTTLYSFNATGGYYPGGGLTLASNGYFYGVNLSGGLVRSGGCGTIFKIDTFGALTAVHAFNDTDPRKLPGVPNLAGVHPILIGPITDLLTFYADVWLAAPVGDLSTREP
jgi:uncharacterized repeat protein (TIGR03803 family)